MRRYRPLLRYVCISLGIACFTACGSSSSPANGTGGTGAPGTGGVSGGTGGAASGTGGTTNGTGGAASGTGSAASGTDAAPDGNGGDSGGSGAGSTTLTGTLGALGAVKPIVSTLWISNSGETLVYMSSATITCDQLMVSRWLGAATAGSQVVEIVIKGAPKLADYPVPPGEVNFAAGGKSSAYETNATTGKIHFTSADAQVLEGSVMATYGADNISGTFHATFCANGQGY